MRRVPAGRSTTRPARLRTRRWRETAGRLIGSTSAISCTERSPPPSSSTIVRRFGSPSASNGSPAGRCAAIRSGRLLGAQLEAVGERLHPIARILLFFASWLTSARPSASRSGGRSTPNRPRRPFFRPYQPPTGLSAERPQASTVPSGAAFCSSAPPRGTQPPCALSQACRSLIARASYRSFVPPTWQTMVGGSDAASRNIVYSELPGGVLRTQGSSFVPLPFVMSVALPCASVTAWLPYQLCHRWARPGLLSLVVEPG